MGQSQQNIISNHWQLVKQSPQGNRIVFDKSGRLGEEYNLTLPSHIDPHLQFQIYNKRKFSQLCIVGVYGAQYYTLPTCCDSQVKLRVITEHLQMRLSQMMLVNPQQVLYLLNEAVTGYAYLYKQVGCFEIRSNMLGLTSEGELRAWINQNLAANWPQYPKNTVPVYKREGFHIDQEENFMVNQLINLIKQHTQPRIYQQTFRTTLEGVNTFQEVKNAVNIIRNGFRLSEITRIDYTRSIVRSRS